MTTMAAATTPLGIERVWTTELARHTGERIRLAGWLHRLRRLSYVSFLLLRDGQGLAQIVIEDDALSERLSALHPETVIVVEGRAVAEPQAPGGVEVREPCVTVLSAVREPT